MVKMRYKIHNSFYKRAIFYICIIFVVVIVCIFSAPKPVKFIKMDLQTMIDELDIDSSSAKKDYNDKYIEVVGKIVNIDSDDSYFSIEPVGELHLIDNLFNDSLLCLLKNNETNIDFINSHLIGDIITVRGQITDVGEILGYTLKVYELSD